VEVNARKWINIGQEVITWVQKYKSIPLQLHDLNFMNELNEIFQACNQDFAAQFTATWSCIKGQNQIY
jgi:hypothetical protein